MDYYLSLQKGHEEEEEDSDEDESDWTDYSDYEDSESYDCDDDFDEEADLLSRAMDHDDSDRYMYMDMYTRKYIDGEDTSDESDDDEADEGTLKAFLQLRTLLRRAGEYTGFFTSKIDKMRMKLRSQMKSGHEEDVEEGNDCLEEEFSHLGLDEDEGESDEEEEVSDNDLEEMNAFSELKSTSRFMKHWSGDSRLNPLTHMANMYPCKPSCLLSGYPHELCMGFSGPRAKPWSK